MLSTSTSHLTGPPSFSPSSSLSPSLTLLVLAVLSFPHFPFLVPLPLAFTRTHYQILPSGFSYFFNLLFLHIFTLQCVLPSPRHLLPVPTPCLNPSLPSYYSSSPLPPPPPFPLPVFILQCLPALPSSAPRRRLPSHQPRLHNAAPRLVASSGSQYCFPHGQVTLDPTLVQSGIEGDAYLKKPVEKGRSLY